MSSGDFVPTLEGFFGSSAGLSASVITRLTTQWQDEHRHFSNRSLKDKDFVYVWVDGVHFNVRLAEDRLCVLVMVGVRLDGTKGLDHDPRQLSRIEGVVVGSASRLKRRGMTAPVLAIGDGALGFWRRCVTCGPTPVTNTDWFHKVANVLDALPKTAQPTTKKMLTEIRDTEDHDHAVAAAKTFANEFRTPSSPRRSRRSPTTLMNCSRSTTSRPSTGSTSRRRTRSSPPSPPCGCARKWTKGPARVLRDSR